jgi:hypothetical protein
VAMNDQFVGEDLALPFRQSGGFALPTEEENGENPSDGKARDARTDRKPAKPLYGWPVRATPKSSAL